MIGDGRSSVSNSTSTTSDGGDDHEFPFGDDDHAEQDEGSSDDTSEDDSEELPSLSAATSPTFLHMSELEIETPDGGILQEQNEEDADAGENSGGGEGSNLCWEDAHNISPQSTSQQQASPSSPSVIIPHRGSLRRILNPSSLLDAKHPDHSNHSEQLPNSAWPIYIINIATEDFQQHNQCYRVIFDRQQYEFCTRLFAVLDTESESVVGPGCIREFVSLHCPVVRRRDNAIFALRSSDDCEINERNEGSPTFDEIWNNTIHSDPNIACTDGATYRIGIEGWMIFCRILALAHHQETQRRFASRHLQQMMRHKHGGGSNTGRSNEVVVMVENPPPGPPALISLCSLVEVEKGRMTSQPEQCIQGWPFCPLPLPELDLDLYLEYGTKFRGMTREPRGRVSIEQFSSAKDGDFILRWCKSGCTTVVRRSYSDFQWLHGILEYHKRPGQGHLCGRILPPLPSSQGGFLQQHSTKLSSGVPQPPKDISERAIGVAKSGIRFISSITKSVLSGLVTPSAPSSSPQTSLLRNTVGQIGNTTSQADILADAAQRIERYLNYLLENDVFSMSFPLNAVLKASQSGLESAKQILRDHTKHTKRQRSDFAAAIIRDRSHSAASIFSVLIHKTSTSIMRFQGDDDTRWLRAAAQVAMTLQFHGILETTGHESASAKIQHASLPKFGHQRAESWDDDETFHDRQQSSDCNSPRNETNFEVGVVNVESELVDDEQDLGGYDLLPSPGPSEENRVLNAGVSYVQISGESPSMTFTYDASPEQSKENHDKKDAVVGSVKVERDIDKLRDIILSTKNTLDRLYRSSALIQSALSTKNGILLCILRDVDSWADNGSEVITQRALVSGVASLEESSNDNEEANKALTDDLLWQSLLASSAVAAVSEVRDLVKASRTASRAKSAAYVAAEKSKNNYESCDPTLPIERVRRAQLDASTAQSHAIHATVVEFEANVAKKRSAIFFAHDVKSWNQHRKHELLRACIQAAKSQRDACRKAADAWESIRDGLVDFSTSTVAIDEVNPISNLLDNSPVRLTPTKKQDMLDLDVLTSSYGFDVEETNNSSLDTGRVVQSPNEVGSEKQSPSEFVTDAFEEGLSYFNSLKGSEHSDTEGDVYCLSPAQFSHLNENYFSYQQEIIAKSDTESDDTNSEAEHHHASIEDFTSHNDSEALLSPRDPMSTSMESLIDGLLMAWGDEDGNEVNEEELRISSNSDILLG